MKSQPWHSKVDAMIAVRPMTTSEVFSALQHYYFTPIYDARTRRSRLPSGRAFFPRFQQVTGYLTHSNLFVQSIDGDSWSIKQTHAAEDVQYSEEGYELRPIGWRPGTGYRDESYPSEEVYRTYDEAVEWIRNQERAQHQDSLDALLNSTKLYVYDVEYSSMITDHPDWQLGIMPSDFGHEAYHWYRGWRYDQELREYVSEPIPELPSEVLMQLKKGDSGIRTRNDFELGGLENIIQNYLSLVNNGLDAQFQIISGREPVLGRDFMTIGGRGYELVAREQKTLDVLFEEEIDKIITQQIKYQTGGIATSFKWRLVDNYWFNDMNPQIAREGVLLMSDVLSDRVHDGLWLTEVANLQYKSSDAWDCTQDMNVDTGAEYRERMLYGGCAGNSATYFTYPGGGNFPYYVEPVVLDL
tara:strand:- start:1363 stop:2601 length:1239 start_codon:yes stop_codon:yes gene_type:complete